MLQSGRVVRATNGSEPSRSLISSWIWFRMRTLDKVAEGICGWNHIFSVTMKGKDNDDMTSIWREDSYSSTFLKRCQGVGWRERIHYSISERYNRILLNLSFMAKNPLMISLSPSLIENNFIIVFILFQLNYHLSLPSIWLVVQAVLYLRDAAASKTLFYCLLFFKDFPEVITFTRTS